MYKNEYNEAVDVFEVADWNGDEEECDKYFLDFIKNYEVEYGKSNCYGQSGPKWFVLGAEEEVAKCRVDWEAIEYRKEVHDECQDGTWNVPSVP